MTDASGTHWTVDKRIPLALILALTMQTSGFAFYMGQLSTRLEQAERHIATGAGNGDRLTRLEVKLETISEQLRRVEGRLQQQGG